MDGYTRILVEKYLKTFPYENICDTKKHSVNKLIDVRNT